jgi:hypothetical protein
MGGLCLLEQLDSILTKDGMLLRFSVLMLR